MVARRPVDLLILDQSPQRTGVRSPGPPARCRPGRLALTAQCRLGGTSAIGACRRCWGRQSWRTCGVSEVGPSWMTCGDRYSAARGMIANRVTTFALSDLRTDCELAGGSVAPRLPKMSNTWCCVTTSPCCAEPTPNPRMHWAGRALLAALIRLLPKPVRAENHIHTGQAARPYSWRTPPRRSCRRMARHSILPGSRGWGRAMRRNSSTDLVELTSRPSAILTPVQDGDPDAAEEALRADLTLAKLRAQHLKLRKSAERRVLHIAQKDPPSRGT